MRHNLVDPMLWGEPAFAKTFARAVLDFNNRTRLRDELGATVAAVNAGFPREAALKIAAMVLLAAVRPASEYARFRRSAFLATKTNVELLLICMEATLRGKKIA
jgi:hypothetical protein